MLSNVFFSCPEFPHSEEEGISELTHTHPCQVPTSHKSIGKWVSIPGSKQSRKVAKLI